MELEGQTHFALHPSLRGADLHLAGWVPAVDIYETEAKLILVLDVPGVDKQDVEVELVGDVLSIRGQKRFLGSSAGERYYRVECAYGPFERSFVIRSPVDRDAVKASFRNGVLRITLPKAGQTSRSIPVKSSQGQTQSSGGEE